MLYPVPGSHERTAIFDIILPVFSTARTAKMCQDESKTCQDESKTCQDESKTRQDESKTCEASRKSNLGEKPAAGDKIWTKMCEFHSS